MQYVVLLSEDILTQRWALQYWLGILPLLCIAAIFCSCLEVVKYVLMYKIWLLKCAKWQDHKILPHLSTCTLIYGTPFELQLEGNILWSTLILIKICGNKIRCKMKTNGYLMFNYSSLDVYELQSSGFWPFVITCFNAAVLTFCGRFELNGMTPHGWQLVFPNCPAIVQMTLGAVKTCLSFSEVDCCHFL
jgi:hypothetical protein